MVVDKIRVVMQVCLSVIATVLLPSVVLAQSSNPAWTDELSSQLLVSKQCEVTHYSSVLEKTENNQIHYLARAHCADGREFYGERTSEADRFVITSCGVSVC